MTPQEQRVAIAEACGWKWYRRPATGPWAKKPMRALYHPQINPEYVATLQPAGYDNHMTPHPITREFLVAHNLSLGTANYVMVEIERLESELEDVKTLVEAISAVSDTPDLSILPGVQSENGKEYLVGVRRGLIIAENIALEHARKLGLCPTKK